MAVSLLPWVNVVVKFSVLSDLPLWYKHTHSFPLWHMLVDVDVVQVTWSELIQTFNSSLPKVMLMKAMDSYQSQSLILLRVSKIQHVILVCMHSIVLALI